MLMFSIDIHWKNESAFRCIFEDTCQNEFYDQAKWLNSISNKNIYIPENLKLVICEDLKFCQKNYNKLQSIEKIKNNRFITNTKIQLINVIKLGLKYRPFDVIRDVMKKILTIDD